MGPWAQLQDHPRGGGSYLLAMMATATGSVACGIPGRVELEPCVTSPTSLSGRPQVGGLQAASQPLVARRPPTLPTTAHPRAHVVSDGGAWRTQLLPASTRCHIEVA